MIILRQKEFNSKAQKKLREKYEVLRGQDLVDKDNKEFLRTADKELKIAAAENLPENHPKVKQAVELKSRAIVGDQLSEQIRKNPEIGTNFTNGREGFLNHHKVYNKQLARSGMDQETFLKSGGIQARNEKNKNRPRGAKKVRGRKQQIQPETYESRFNALSDSSKEKLRKKINKRQKVRDSIAKHEARAAELKTKKELGQILNTSSKVALGTLGVAAAGYGAKKAYDHYKNKDK